jgi:nucleotide-binding universal stress UspA family protein
VYDPIILALDGSDLSEEAIPHAVALARDFGAEILVVRAVELPREYYEVAPYMAPAVASSLIDEAYQQAEAYVRGHVEALQAKGLRARGRCRSGDPATVILEAADEHRGGVVVIATHGRSGLSRWAMGSVADRVVRHSPVPVLLIRSGQPIPLPRAEKAESAPNA